MLGQGSAPPEASAWVLHFLLMDMGGGLEETGSEQRAEDTRGEGQSFPSGNRAALVIAGAMAMATLSWSQSWIVHMSWGQEVQPGMLSLGTALGLLVAPTCWVGAGWWSRLSRNH